MKHNCEIVRDLLPLYAEQIASPASTALVEEHLAECPACRAELQRMEKPVTVQPEPQADAPLKTIQIALTRRRVHTILVTLLVVLAVVLGVFARDAYTAYDKVGFFEARLQASYETADNGDKGWVLEVRGEDVYLMQMTDEWTFQPIRYRFPRNPQRPCVSVWNGQGSAQRDKVDAHRPLGVDRRSGYAGIVLRQQRHLAGDPQ